MSSAREPRRPRIRVEARVVAVLVAFGLALSTVWATPAYAATSSRILGVPIYIQEQSYWCWVASAQMIYSFERTGVVPTQCSIAWGAGFQGCPNAAGTDSDVQRALTALGLRSTSATGAPIFSLIKVQMDASQPVEYSYKWKSSYSKHVVVISGYSWDPNNSSTWSVYWNDPLIKTRQYNTYAYLMSNSSWAASFYIYNIA